MPPSGFCLDRKALEVVFDEVITVDILDSGDSAHLTLMKRPELGITLTKLHCWSLTQYSKCVFMDADTLVSGARGGARIPAYSYRGLLASRQCRHSLRGGVR